MGGPGSGRRSTGIGKNRFVNKVIEKSLNKRGYSKKNAKKIVKRSTPAGKIRLLQIKQGRA